jgi:DNA repair protein RecO (recombination protein O)
MSAGQPQQAYVLHARPYRETSALVDFFTPAGRVSGVLRGARGKAGSLARPFVPLSVEFRGKSELRSVARLEPSGASPWLMGEALFSGLYLNELLVRLLPFADAQPTLYEHYHLTLQALALGRPLEPLLRAFEWRLLVELGYAFALDHDSEGSPVVEGGLYRLSVDEGLERVMSFAPGLFHGADLLAMAAADWATPGALLAAKRLMRQALAAHLGGKPLMSRELFRKV